MSELPHGRYTDEDGFNRPLHNHNTAVIGGPPSRYRHITPFSEHSMGGKLIQVAMVGVIAAFNVFLGWVLGRAIGFW